MRLRSHLALHACLLLIALAGPASAFSAGWLAPVQVTPPPAAGTTNAGANVLTNAAGAQVIMVQVRGDDGDAVCFATDVISRAPGGAFSAPTRVPNCYTTAAISPSGEVVVTWEDSNVSVQAASGPAGSPLSEPALVGEGGPGIGIVYVKVAFDGTETPTVAFSTIDLDNGFELHASTRQSTGEWSDRLVDNGAAAGQTAEIALSVSPAGAAFLVWPNATDPATPPVVRTMKAAWKPAGEGDWIGLPPAAGPSQTDSYGTPYLVTDAQGVSTAVWPVSVNGADIVLAARTLSAPPSPAWGAEEPMPVPASGFTPSGQLGALVADPAGDVQGAWKYTGSGGASRNVRAFSRPAGTTAWSGADLFATAQSSDPSFPIVSFDPAHTATIMFTLAGGLYRFDRRAGSTTYAQITLPAAPSGSSTPVTATDHNGYTVATWVDASGIAFSSVYDPIAPVVEGVTPPTDPVAGQPASFTVAGSDLWGPVTFTIDFGDGQSASGRAANRLAALGRADGGGTVTHTYGAAGSYTATITVADGAANTATTTRPVAVGTAPAAVPTPEPLPLPPIPGLPDPVLGRTVNVFPVKPPVLVREPGARRFVLLTQPKQIRVGSVIDTRKGRVRITIAGAKGKLETADFYQGMFKILQRRTGSKFASLQLFGGRFRGCPRAPKAQLSRKKLSKKRTVRKLWGNGSGSFRTVGRFSAAAIRGTTWLTQDRCDGTLTRVTKGSVSVRDFVKRKTIVVRAPKRYLARPKRR